MTLPCMHAFQVVCKCIAVALNLTYLHEIFCVSGIERICPQVDVPL